MKTSWQTETGRLECRWSGLWDGVQEKSPVVQEASTGVYESFAQPLPDFASHSLLGSGEWFVP
jgi:hypothetical protein